MNGELPIDGVLDLHTFQPREIKDLVPDYLADVSSAAFWRVRIIMARPSATCAARCMPFSRSIHR